MTTHQHHSHNTAAIQGHFREEGGSLSAGRLYLRRDAGGWYDPDMQLPGQPDIYVTARQYRITADIMGIEIEGCGGQPFLPDDGECERIGLPVHTVD